jgi:penicillin-binding protein 1A
MMAIDAFRMSLNVPAVEVSLRVGRQKVLEMTKRLGVVGVKMTCSMALGDLPAHGRHHWG